MGKSEKRNVTVFVVTGVLLAGGVGLGVWQVSSPAAPTTTKVAAPAPTKVATPTTTKAATPAKTTLATIAKPAPTAGGAGAQKYGQCGGIGFTGPTTCASGCKCVKQNDWYSQCL